MQARSIIAKISAGALYGAEAAETTSHRINQLTAATIFVFRSRNDNNNIDGFFSSFLADKVDIDPIVQIFTRRAMQITRTTCQKPEAKGKTQKILQAYAQSETTTPKWYHDIDVHGTTRPTNYPRAQDRRGPNSTSLNHQDIDASDPVGLLISSMAWNGFEAHTKIRRWEECEEPIDLLQTLYQFLSNKTSSTGN